MHEIDLCGLDGGDLLGFLAALGTLRILSLREAGVRMRWRDTGDSWQPVVQHPRIATSEELVEMVSSLVCGESTINEAWRIGDDLTLEVDAFRKHVKEHATKAKRDQREVADFLAAFGSEAYGDEITDTAFRTMSGASNQHFLAFMQTLAESSDKGHIRRTLLEPWDYSDERPSMRWSWTDYRPHALRATDPSDQKKDPIRTMRGANRLALEALPLFPTVPGCNAVRTLAFERRGRETEVTWPTWTCAIDLRTAQSLIALEELQDADPAKRAHVLARRGIVQIFRARRFVGPNTKNRNFSRARALL